MSVRVIYSTGGFVHKNGGKSGTQSERFFPSIDEAKAAAFPQGYTFAFIPVKGPARQALAISFQEKTLHALLGRQPRNRAALTPF